MASLLIVEKNGSIKSITVKSFNENEIYKKCGFKKGDDFLKQTEWTVKCSGKKYIVAVYGKTVGRANNENKYDFPPPIDSVLFFGSCAILGREEGSTDFSLSVELWEKMYEKLFGGFEDFAATAEEDENEIDELAGVPKEKKTKQGYLKDGFVVDSSDTEESNDKDTHDEDEFEDEYDDDEEEEGGDGVFEGEEEEEEEDSELSEEDYDYEE